MAVKNRNNGRVDGDVHPDTRAFPELPKLQEKTDPLRWRIKDEDSNHTWHYLENEEDVKKWPQSYAEKYFLNLPLVWLPLFYRTSLCDKQLTPLF